MQSKGQEQDINKSCRYGKNQQNHLKNHSQAYTLIFLMNVKWFLQCPEQLWIRLIIDHLFYPLQFYWTIQFLKYLIDLSRVVYTEPNVSCNESFGSRHLRFLERPSQKKKQQREQSHPVTLALGSPIQGLLNQTQTSCIIRETTRLSQQRLQPWSLTNSPALFCVPCSSLMDGELHFSNVASLLMRKDSRHPHDSTFLNEPHNWRFMILFGRGLSGSRTK